MSKEQKFHRLIEESEREEKDCVWAKIKQEESIRAKEEQDVSIRSVRREFSWRKTLAVGGVSVAILLVSGFAALKLLPGNFTADNSDSSSSWTGVNSVDSVDSSDSSNTGNRYCDNTMYTAVLASYNLKNLSHVNQETLLYLDWYQMTDFCETNIYQLNETQEAIGYYEQISDINTGSLITIHILKDGYQLDTLERYKDSPKSETISETVVLWKWTEQQSYAYFQYLGLEYYISMDYPMEETSILDIIEELLG